MVNSVKILYSDILNELSHAISDGKLWSVQRSSIKCIYIQACK